MEKDKKKEEQKQICFHSNLLIKNDSHTCKDCGEHIPKHIGGVQ